LPVGMSRNLLSLLFLFSLFFTKEENTQA
jgi:hypothetical protein